MKQKILYIILMITALVGGKGEVWGQTPYYVVNDPTEREVMTSSSSSKTINYQLSGPGHTLTFDIRDNSGVATGKHYIYLYNLDGNQLAEYSYNAGTSWETKTISNIPLATAKISIKGSGTLKKLVRNVKVTRATTFSAPTEVNVGDLQINTTVDKSFKIDYSNTYDQTLTATCTEGIQLETNSWTIKEKGPLTIPFKITATKLEKFTGTISFTRGNDTFDVSITGQGVGMYTPEFEFKKTSVYTKHVYKISDLFSTTSPTNYTITVKPGDANKARLIGDKLFVFAESGDFSLIVSQEGNEQWYPKTEQYKVSVVAGNSATHAEQIDGFSIFQGGEKTINFTFPTKSISYSVEKQDLAADYGVAVSLSIDHGVSWNSIGKDENITTNVQNFTKSIPQNSTHIKFERLWDGILGPTLSLYYTNVYCHMASYMTPSQTNVACGRTMVGNTSEVQNITIDWSDVYKYSDNLKVMCDNPNFSVSVVNNPCTPANQTWGTSNERWGQSTISVTYTPKEEGNHTGNIYFYDNKRFITIHVSGEAYNALILSPNTNPNTQITDGGVVYSKVQLNRALPKGYFTATFPFDYNISVIPNAFVAQLELVTHNQQDGYTLYFKKVADGQMLANQPYVVYLPEAISNPEWADVIIMRPEEGSVRSDKTKGWTMRANYTPEMS
ncbi:MAG: hypothetical protein II287_05465, partial [Bacteroidaceae bacterium]|nr:hypothetical protein [Bacteroidaceae bacterium]